MFLVRLRIVVPPAAAAQREERMARLDPLLAKQPGFLARTWLTSLGEPNEHELFELWDDQAAWEKWSYGPSAADFTAHPGHPAIVVLHGASAWDVPVPIDPADWPKLGVVGLVDHQVRPWAERAFRTVFDGRRAMQSQQPGWVGTGLLRYRGTTGRFTSVIGFSDGRAMQRGLQGEANRALVLSDGGANLVEAVNPMYFYTPTHTLLAR